MARCWYVKPWLCFLLNRHSISCYLFQFWCSKWCSIWVSIYLETILSFLCVQLTKKCIPLPVKFLSGALPTFVGRGLDGCVTAHWIWNCSVLWVANFLNTSSTEKCTMGICTVVQKQTMLSPRRSWGLELSRSTWNISRKMNFSNLLSLKWGSLEVFFFFFFSYFLKQMYTFSLWKGQGVWSNPPWINLYHIFLIYIFYCDLFQLYKCQLVVHGTIYSSIQFTIGVGRGSFIFMTWN